MEEWIASLALWVEGLGAWAYVGAPLLMAAVAGTFGGFLSFSYRSGTIPDNPSAGKSRHHFDGFTRAIGAAIGGAFIALAIKANVLLGFLGGNGSADLATLLLAGMLAGLSERLVPNIVRSLNDQIPTLESDRTTAP